MEPQPSSYAIKFRHIFFALLVILIALAIVTYNPGDTAVLEGGTDSSHAITNAIGLTGAQTARFCFYWLGVATYPILLVMIAGAVRSVFPRLYKRRGYIIGLLLFALGCSILFGLNPGFFTSQTARLGIGHADAAESALSGGVIGQWIAAPGSEFAPEGMLRGLIGVVGTLIFGWILGLAGMIMMIYADWRDVGEYVLAARSAKQRDDEEREEELVAPAPRKERTFTPAAQKIQPQPKEEQVEAAEQEETEKLQKKSFFDLFKRKEKEIPQTDYHTEAEGVELPLETNPQDINEPARPWRVHNDEPLTSVLQNRQTPPQPPAQEQIQDLQPAQTPIPAQFPVRAQALPPKVSNINFTITVPGSEPTVQTANIQQPVPGLVSAPLPPSNNTNQESRLPVGQPEEMRPPVIMPEAPDTAAIPGEHPVVRTTLRYTIPPHTMLSIGANICKEPIAEIEENKAILQDVMDAFKVEGQVSGHIWGPRVTRYNITLAPGVDVSKITKLHNNIKMNLRANSIRILAPIPGQEAVGIEVPNTTASAVFAREIMESKEWQDTDYDIPVVLGKNVSGQPVIMDLAKAPHLLIAGQTGSGKSVCMNTLIMSLLLHFSLEDLQLILVDPKVVEHAPYKTLPHLITPVINDANRVPFALRWAVSEMEKRFRIFAPAGVKNLKEYNQKLSVTSMMDEYGKPLPRHFAVLIIIIDELADLMMTDSRADVELNINRIAAKGRAAGIHIVVATQTPRKDIITGTIKANLPTRISFAVSSQMDSRVILDKNGAETLLGKGDMLFMSSGGQTERIQGAWVQDDDIVDVVKFISKQAAQTFDGSVVASNEENEEEEPQNETSDDRDYRRTTATNAAPIVQKYLQPGDDDLVARALEIILTDKKASTSALQRRLKIGYNRAADLMDLFESRGLIGPDQQGGKPRAVLVFDGIESGDY